MKKAALVLGCIVLSSCSFIQEETPPVPTEKLSQVRYSLYVSRASLTTTEFEQYKVLPAGLFAECGTINRGRPETREQGIEKFNDDALKSSRELAYKVYQKLSAPEVPAVDQPGTNANLADPGKYILSIQVDGSSAELKTSLDFVERKQSSIAVEANELTQLIRSMTTKPPCGNSEFYGIGRRAS